MLTKSFIVALTCLSVLSLVNCDEKVEVNEVKVEQDVLKVEVITKVEECERKSEKGDILHVHYNGTLENGKVFDENNDEKYPFPFQLGMNYVIKGWDEGLVGMCIGEKRRLTIPPHLGYGDQGGFGVNIPPKATLFFDIKLLAIKDTPDLDKLFENLDQNKDGSLSQDEMAIQITKEIEQGGGEEINRVDEIVGEVFQLQDRDKDGVLSKEEFTRPQESHDEL